MNITAGANSTILNSKSFTPLPTFDIDFELRAKIFNQEGDLAYEYNPFHNLRDATTGELKDFSTTGLQLNLNNPVDIEIQPSYDGTMNLVINDDLNPPRIVNSRFTPVEDGRYQIIDRAGNTDTNIYEESAIEDVIRLYKTSERIPYVVFNGLSEGGSLKSGNYVFYFKYSDADGNESDIITESGIVSCYIGKLNDPFSTRGGLVNELTNKIAKLTLNNLDTTYDYLNIYFTRSTSDMDEIEITEAYKIVSRKTINNSNTLTVTITGLEDVQQISVDELNLQYSIVDHVKTQAQVQNMLFFGNVDKPTIPYKELSDLALRIYPTIANDSNVGYLDQNYKPLELDDELLSSEYYDASNVYKYTGYWNKEMYRFGVVFVMKDDSLSPVFNVRGKDSVGLFSRAGTFAQDIASVYTYKSVYDGSGNRQYIDYDDDGFIKDSNQSLENTKGVIRIAYDEEVLNKNSSTGVYPLSIAFNIDNDTLALLKTMVKGFFFVRQKRIPTILCQALSIGVDNVSFIPTIKAQIYGNTATPTTGYITESFVDKTDLLVHDFPSRLLIAAPGQISVGGLLCPEASLRSTYFNEVFTGALFNVSKAQFSPSTDSFTQSVSNSRQFYISGYNNNGSGIQLYKDVKLTFIEDNQPLRYSGTKRFSTRVGIPEEAWRFSWFGAEDRGRYATNIIRGAYGGFVGCENYPNETTLIDIHIPGYDVTNMRDYFLLRANSFHPFYAMSNRYDLNLVNANSPYDTTTVQSDNIQFQEYRGDCFISTFTTRILRNFADPETPINDTIVDTLTWKTNYTGYTASGGLDATSIAKINRGDVNAVMMGHWATFKLCSNINLAYRAIDQSHSSEYALTGKARSFFPLSSMSTSGESKIPESTIANVGYNSTTSDKMYLTLPDVPYIKNIFDSRLMFSEIHVGDQFRNGYRIFKLDAYKDLTKQYGAITKILEWQNNLMVIFEDGIGLIPINEKMIGAQGNGNNAFISSTDVLPSIINPITTNFGSSWKDSIVQSADWVYGLDATAKKVWRTNGKEFELISDFKVQKFLNDNITLTENDKTSLVALRNIKTHYNAFKKDIMFTYYDSNADNGETLWSLCYNEITKSWITRYSWTPLESADISNVYFSFDRESAKKLAMVGYSIAANPESSGIVIDNAQVNAPTAGTLVGTLSLKGYDYYSKYIQTFTIDPSFDSTLFTLTKVGNGYNLYYNGGAFTKYSFTLRIRAGLSSDLGGGNITEVQHFYDYIGLVVNRDNLDGDDKLLYDNDISNWFWKHGQAGIFDNATTLTPTNWYGKQEVFEYEFVVVDNPNFHKIWDNLVIISNDAEPDSFEYELVGDSYSIDRTVEHDYTNADGTLTSTITPELVHVYQKGLNLKDVGRRLGNMHYKEDFWDVEIRPVRYNQGDKVKEFRLRDKFIRIRVRYSGTDLAIITALTTTYTQSYA